MGVSTTDSELWAVLMQMLGHGKQISSQVVKGFRRYTYFEFIRKSRTNDCLKLCVSFDTTAISSKTQVYNHSLSQTASIKKYGYTHRARDAALLAHASMSEQRCVHSSVVTPRNLQLTILASFRLHLLTCTWNLSASQEKYFSSHPA